MSRISLTPGSRMFGAALVLFIGCSNPLAGQSGSPAHNQPPSNRQGPDQNPGRTETTMEKSEPKSPSAPVRVMLRVPTSATAQVRDLKLTLLEFREVTVQTATGVQRGPQVRLRIERAGETKQVSLEQSQSLFGHLLKLVDAGDGQATPQSPREIFAAIDVTAVP